MLSSYRRRVAVAIGLDTDNNSNNNYNISGVCVVYYDTTTAKSQILWFDFRPRKIIYRFDKLYGFRSARLYYVRPGGGTIHGYKRSAAQSHFHPPKK